MLVDRLFGDTAAFPFFELLVEILDLLKLLQFADDDISRRD